MLIGTGAGWEQTAERGGGPAIPMKHVLLFIGLQAAAIHAADPWALVTIGAWSEATISSNLGPNAFNYYSTECLAAALDALLYAPKMGDSNVWMDSALMPSGARLDYVQVHSYSPARKGYTKTQPFSKHAGGYGLRKPLVVGEFAGGIHSGGLNATHQYQYLADSGYAGSWAWSASNLDFFPAMRELRATLPAVRIELPTATSVAVCTGQWPWTEPNSPASSGRRLIHSEDEHHPMPLATLWRPADYLEEKLSARARRLQSGATVHFAKQDHSVRG